MNHHFCNFIQLSDEEYQCTKCDIVIISQDGDIPIFPCMVFEPYANENLCSLEQIEKRYSICNSCEFFQNNTCIKCDCVITRNLNYTNKLFYKDQECPELKWTKED